MNNSKKVTLDSTGISNKKGEPTPKRKEQEEARKKPLIPKDRKAAKQESRRTMSMERQKIKAGIAAGDERYLTPRDSGPQRRYVRQYIDTRWNVGEFFIPIMFPLLFLSYIRHPIINIIFTAAMGLMFTGMIVDGFIIRKNIKKRLTKNFGSPEKGTTSYAVLRATQFRGMRIPKPIIKRSEKID